VSVGGLVERESIKNDERNVKQEIVTIQKL
jgi:hypothetical protein